MARSRPDGRQAIRAVANALIENEATQAVMMVPDPDKPQVASLSWLLGSGSGELKAFSR
jgi:hypothetical protein